MLVACPPFLFTVHKQCIVFLFCFRPLSWLRSTLPHNMLALSPRAREFEREEAEKTSNIRLSARFHWQAQPQIAYVILTKSGKSEMTVRLANSFCRFALQKGGLIPNLARICNKLFASEQSFLTFPIWLYVIISSHKRIGYPATRMWRNVIGASPVRILCGCIMRILCMWYCV
jgi:hypothetical protein